MSFSCCVGSLELAAMNTGRALFWAWLLLGIQLGGSTVIGAEVDLADLFAKTSPSVVTLTTYSSTGQKTGQGSGFIVDKSGVIVTCNHVVARAAAIEVETPDETVQTATEIIRTDKDWDVALIRVPGLS